MLIAHAVQTDASISDPSWLKFTTMDVRFLLCQGCYTLGHCEQNWLNVVLKLLKLL